MTTQTATTEFALVDVDHVHPHPRNVRRTVTGVDELAESIKAGGLHQPLVVAPADAADDTAGYTLVMGHRRLAAVQSLGWSEVPCIIRHDLDTEARVLEAMLAENVARTDLTVTEEGDAVQALLDLDVKPAKIAKAIGRSTRHVKDRAQIATALTEKARQAVDDGQITITDALHLSKLDGDVDHELAAKVERAIGTPNFRYTLERAIQEAEFNRKRAAVIAELEAEGATVTDGPAPAGLDEVRVFLAHRPDDVTDPQVSVYVSEWTGWGSMRVQWVAVRPRAEEDPDEGDTFVSNETTADDADGDDAAEEARKAAEQALRDERLEADRRARRERETAQAARQRWLHEKWTEGMPSEAGTHAQLLRDLVTVPGGGYAMTADRTRIAPIVAGPGVTLDADDPALDPVGWSLDRLIFAAWWIHYGWRRDSDAAAAVHAWDDETVAYLENLAVNYDYPLSEVEEALIKEYAAWAAEDEQPEEDG